MWTAMTAVKHVGVLLLAAEANPVAQLQEWSGLAAQYGPYFFALLFLCVLVWQAGKRMSSAEGESQRRVWRRLLYSTFCFGVALVGFSV